MNDEAIRREVQKAYKDVGLNWNEKKNITKVKSQDSKGERNVFVTQNYKPSAREISKELGVPLSVVSQSLKREKTNKIYSAPTKKNKSILDKIKLKKMTYRKITNTGKRPVYDLRSKEKPKNILLSDFSFFRRKKDE